MDKPRYMILAQAILDNKAVAFSSVFLSSVYKGPSSLSIQHLYERVILEWLERSSGIQGRDTIPTQTLDLASQFWNLTIGAEEKADPTSNIAIELLEGLTGESNASSLAGGYEEVDSMVDGMNLSVHALNGMTDLLNMCSDIRSVYWTEKGNIELLAKARDVSDNEDFNAAATRVVDAYNSAVNQQEANGSAIWGSQLSALGADNLMSAVWDTLSKDNPLLSTGMTLIDLVFSSGKQADANMMLIGIDVVGNLLRRGLSDAMPTNGSSGIKEQGAVFVRCFKSYLSYQIFGIDTASNWAAEKLEHWSTDKEAAKDVIDSCDGEKGSRKDLLKAIQSYSDDFWDLENYAMAGSCSCATCANDADPETSDDDAGPATDQSEAPASVGSTEYEHVDGEYLSRLQIDDQNQAYLGFWYDSGRSASMEDFSFSWIDGQNEYQVMGQRSKRMFRIKVSDAGSGSIRIIVECERPYYAWKGGTKGKTIWSDEVYSPTDSVRSIQSNSSASADNKNVLLADKLTELIRTYGGPGYEATQADDTSWTAVAKGVCFADLVDFGDGAERLIVAYRRTPISYERPSPEDYVVEVWRYDSGNGTGKLEGTTNATGGTNIFLKVSLNGAALACGLDVDTDADAVEYSLVNTGSSPAEAYAASRSVSGIDCRSMQQAAESVKQTQLELSR